MPVFDSVIVVPCVTLVTVAPSSTPPKLKLAGAIAGRALYDGRLDAAAALALIKQARAARATGA